MRSCKKARILAAVLALSILVCATSVVFAYFSVSGINGGTKNLDVTIPDEPGAYVSVGSFKELFLAGKSPEYNDGEALSEAGTRKTIRFTDNITLDEDMIITADCHIDLNGNRLIMNGHSLTIKHPYYGSFVIRNGTVVLNSLLTNEKIYIDTPNAFIIEISAGAQGALAFKNENDADAESCVTVLALNAKYAAYDMFYMVAGAIMNETNVGAKRLDFAAVQAETERITGTESAIYTFAPSLYISATGDCSLAHGGAARYCSYVFGDIDLPFTYGSYENAEITYESSDTSVLSEHGKVTPPATSATVELTATVWINGAAAAQCTFEIHVIGTDATTHALVGETMIRSYLSRFYVTVASDGSTPAFSGYAFNREVYLPVRFDSLPELTFSYSAMAGASAVPPLNFTTVPETVPAGNDPADVIKFEPVETLTRFTVDITNASNTRVGGFVSDAMSGSSGIIITDSSIASDIVNDWYGGTIEISSVLDNGEIVSFSRHTLHTTTGAWGLTATERSLGVVSVKNELMNNTNDVYEIETTVNEAGESSEMIVVKAGKNPNDYVQTVLLNVTLTFSNGSEEEIQVPINYIHGGSISTNANSFLPYYTFYNELLYSNIAGYTINSFTMPFCYGNGSPIICYDIEGDTSGAVSLALYYGGSEKTTLTLGGGVTSYTAALDNYLEASGVTLDTIINAGDAHWCFNIDTDKIIDRNTNINLVYNYKADKNSGWVRYRNLDTEESIVSTFILAGILRCYNKSGVQTSAEIVRDENLYKWMFDNFNPTFGTDNAAVYDVGNAADRTSKLVYTDWLMQNVPLDRTTNATLGAVSDLAGIQYLKGTKYVNLKGFDMSGSSSVTVDGASVTKPNPMIISEYLSQMSAITELVLSDTNFYDRESAAAADNGTVGLLTHLTALETLYVDTNDIFSFEWLLDLPLLDTVYVYNNFTEYVNGIFYGSEGLTNLSYFQELTDKGVKVYNGISDTNPMLFEEGDSVMDYVNLRGIEYQDVIPVGARISEIYSDFSTSRADYGLAESYTNSAKTVYTVDQAASTLAWGHVGEDTTSTTFTLTYTINWTNAGQNTIVLVLNFNVTRK